MKQDLRPHLSLDFQFSQSRLQDYQDCQRRFELRYLMRLQWPAMPLQPWQDYEAEQTQGALFHRLAQQYILGLPPPAAQISTAPAQVQTWWAHFLATGLRDLPIHRYPEHLLSVNLAGHPLMARYDLIALERGGQAWIVDWKTSRHQPRRAWLEKRLQTRIYRYLLAKAGASLNGAQAIAPEQITMRYWFAHFPNQPQDFPYSTAQFQADEAYLLEMIRGITQQAAFPLTEDWKHCRYCTYRSLCQRQVEPGHPDDAESDPDLPEDPPILELEF
jgi:predicted RecB family nuclease